MRWNPVCLWFSRFKAQRLVGELSLIRRYLKFEISTASRNAVPRASRTAPSAAIANDVGTFTSARPVAEGAPDAN